MSGPQPRPGLLDMAAYVGGREKVDGVENAVKLSANENPLGASPKVLAALRDLGDPSLYPDGHATAHVYYLDFELRTGTFDNKNGPARKGWV